MQLHNIFYIFKPFIPRKYQLFLRRIIIQRFKARVQDRWPIDPSSAKPPRNWEGWPENKRFALVLTHDIDTQTGQTRCLDVAQMEQEMGFSSSFNFVPERYSVESNLRDRLSERGFEIGVHGLNHDGKLYRNRTVFAERAKKINEYLKDWQAVGFRSPSMHHNLEWIHDLNISYDSSTFDTDPFEPQPDGVGTIFPFIVESKTKGSAYVELPYTLPQDFTLFVLMKEKNIDIWKRKLDWIAKHEGMALINTHPDYMKFRNESIYIEEYPAKYYQQLLEYVRTEYEGQFWHALPKEIARYCFSIDTVGRKKR